MQLASMPSGTSRLKSSAMAAHAPRRMTLFSTASVDWGRLVAVTRLRESAEADGREFLLPTLNVDEAIDGRRAGSDHTVLFERGDLGGRQSEPVAVDLAVVLAELRAGHGVDRVGAVDA